MAHQPQRVLIGVSGGIAAYKACELVRLFRKAGVRVRVMMTKAATRFVTPMTFQALSGKPVWLGENGRGDSMNHIRLAASADLVILAPASADLIGRVAMGLGNDFVTTTLLAYAGPVLVAPAMNTKMFNQPMVQRNIAMLRTAGFEIMGPGSGELACGDVGLGKMSEPQEIFTAAMEILQRKDDLKGLRVLVTAGPTVERLDAVRFLSNPSTGKMGYSIAEAAQRRGAKTVLISGPTHLPRPAGVEFLSVESARDMHEAVMQHRQQDVVVMAAAVADFTVENPSAHKTNRSDFNPSVSLTPTPDILEDLGRSRSSDNMPRVLVGFSMETRNLLERTRLKLQRKQVDLMVGNSLDEAGAGFGADTNRVTLVDRDGGIEQWPLLSKKEVAHRLFDRVKTFL